MALLLRLEKPATGESYPEAYHRVTMLTLNATKPAVELTVAVYLTEAARRAGKQPVATYTAPVLAEAFMAYFSPQALDRLATNPIRAAYEYLRTLPAYAEAVNV